MTGSRIGRREFLQQTTVAGTLACLSWPRLPALAFASGATLAATAPYPVRFPKQNPFEPLRRFIDPGQDEFALEKAAVEVTTSLDRMAVTKSLPLAPGFSGSSPRPERFEPVGEGVLEAVFGAAPSEFEPGLRQWLGELGDIRTSRFFVTRIQAGSGGEVDVEVRYEIGSRSPAGLEYRVGRWNQVWRDGRLLRFAPIVETVARSARLLFTEVTARAFAGVDSFESQLLKGVPYWRARLDSASGIDVYGTNGVAVGDIDNDGWDEIYVCQPGGLPDRLYKNRGDGTFEDITARAGLGVLDKTSSALFLDLHNTGVQDLVVLRSSGPLLFLNDGSGRFTLQTGAFRFAHPPQGTFTGMAAADYDRDGRLDLYLCCYHYFQSEDQYRYPLPYHDARNGPPNFLFRNRLAAGGSGFFEDMTDESGLGHNNDRYSFAAAWCDYDGDGWPDLYVANDFGRNNLYRNDGGRFRDVAAEAGVEDIGPGMSAAWFDYDGHGLPDLYVANMWTAVGQRLVREQSFPPASTDSLKEAYHRHSKGNSLYRNRGDGTFEETGAAQNVEMGRWGWSADAVDFDNDGVPEIYATAGMITGGSAGSPDKDLEGFFWRQVVARTPTVATAAPAYETGWNALNQWIREGYSWSGREPNVFYARRNGRYYDLSGISGLDVADDSRAFAVTDFDGDGRVDLVLKSRLGPQLRLFRNDCGVTRRSLAVRLVGTRSNRDGIGARLAVQAGPRTITRWLHAGSGFLSQNTKTLYFGLDQTTVARADIRWPSGLRQEFDRLEAGFVYTLTEGSDEVARAPFRSLPAEPSSPSPIEALSGDNTLALSSTWLLEPIPVPDDRKGPGFLCFTAGPIATAPAGVPFEVIDVAGESSQVAALYAVFRRYLLDWRCDLFLPMVLLVDANGLCHKTYPDIPDGRTLAEDLRRFREWVDGRISREDLALPFAGRYYSPPARNFFQMGTAFYWAGYREAALRYLEMEVRQSPSNFKVLLGIGQIHLEAERYAQAREYLERARLLNDRSAALWNNLGGVEAGEGNLQESIACYERALSLEPDLAHVLANAGQVYAKLGDDEAAEGKLRRALQIEPADADAANQLGLVLARRNRNDEARHWLQQAIAAQRDHADAINNLGVVYAQSGMLNDALATFRYGLEVAPEGRDLYINLARVHVSMGEVEKARDVVRQLLARKPGDPLALKALEELKTR